MEQNKSIFEHLKDWTSKSISLKLFTIGFIVLILLIPQAFISDLINERQSRLMEVEEEVTQKWSRQQEVVGPYISVPYTEYRKIESEKEVKRIKETKTAYFFPEQLNIKGEVNAQKLHRGIFDVAVYTSDLQFDASFSKLDFQKINIQEENLLWKQAKIHIGIADMRGIGENPKPMMRLLLSLILIMNSSFCWPQTFKPSKSQTLGIKFLEKQYQAGAQMLVEIGGIESPSGNEHNRAAKVAAIMREIGLKEVEIDESPNVIGLIQGKSSKKLVFIATLDDLETVAIHQKAAKGLPQIQGNKVIGPGTNTSSITVAMLMAAEAIIQTGIVPEYTLVFAGVAQEETGLEGMKQIYSRYKEESLAFVDILGDGRSISYGAMGIHWYKVEAKGPAGHTLRGGLPNVNQALAKSIDRIFNLPYPESEKGSKTVINISVVESGKVFNHKPENAWFSLDMRSLDAQVLASMEKEVIEILKEVAEETKIELTLSPFQITPGGQLPDALNSGLVQTAKNISAYLGLDPKLSNAGSSNMNVAIAGGSRAIGLGGERGGQRGFPDEWADIDSMMRAAKHVFLLATSSWAQ